jgi:Cft2 family RNA processing exonuclease
MFNGVDYGEAFQPIPGVIARFYEAGHILGSAGVSLEIEEKGKKIRLWFLGDIGRYQLPLLRDPVLPEVADYMIMESTYQGVSYITSAIILRILKIQFVSFHGRLPTRWGAGWQTASRR